MPELATKDSGTCAVITLKRTRLAPKLARTFVRDALSVRNIADNAIWDACLIASELVTNVVQHVDTTDDEMRLCVSVKEGRPLVEVWDPSPQPPVPVENPTGESGRGLTEGVASLSKAWSITILQTPEGGKVVSAWI
jgi:anti-sigma regulatory factor (Ser/Thr protein kinase)